MFSSVRLKPEPMSKFYRLPSDMREKVAKLAAQYHFTIDEVTELYLMGGSHTDYLCQLKLKNAPDILIQLENERLWDEKNKELWRKLRGGDCNGIRTGTVEMEYQGLDCKK